MARSSLSNGAVTSKCIYADLCGIPVTRRHIYYRYKFTQLLRNMRELRVSFWGIGDPEEEQRPGSGEDSGDEGGDGDGGGVGVGGSEYRVSSDDNLSSPSSSSSSSDVEEHPHAD